MYFQKSVTTILVEDFLLEKLWSYGCVDAIILWTELNFFYRRLNLWIFVDSTSLPIFILWKQVHILNSAQNRKAHHGNTFWIKIKVNIKMSADGGSLVRKCGNRRLFATSYRKLSSFLVRLCAFSVGNFWKNARPV